MPMLTHYSDSPPSREEVDALKGPALLEFGTDWCGHCQAAQRHLQKAFASPEGGGWSRPAPRAVVPGQVVADADFLVRRPGGGEVGKAGGR